MKGVRQCCVLNIVVQASLDEDECSREGEFYNTSLHRASKEERLGVGGVRAHHKGLFYLISFRVMKM